VAVAATVMNPPAADDGKPNELRRMIEPVASVKLE